MKQPVAYFSLVRPSLMYADGAWDPYTQTNIKELEKVQRQGPSGNMFDHWWRAIPTGASVALFCTYPKSTK